jgi:hypothetical protein
VTRVISLLSFEVRIVVDRDLRTSADSAFLLSGPNATSDARCAAASVTMLFPSAGLAGWSICLQQSSWESHIALNTGSGVIKIRMVER